MLDRARDYEALLAEGVAESDILRVILVPPHLDPAALLSSCGSAPPLPLVGLVSDRNACVLDAFPAGALHEELQPIDIPLAYARATGGMWTLVDHRYLHRWKVAMTDLDESDHQGILARLAMQFGLKPDELLPATRGDSVPGLEIAMLPAAASYPPILMDHELHVAGQAEQQFTRSEFPLIPYGHLCFFSRFYQRAHA
ncbi:MAG: hypothetical protein JNK04_25515 [Myxococcales bacterium]|nr:hypothetical protein [Myxococcales bacterium]